MFRLSMLAALASLLLFAAPLEAGAAQCGPHEKIAEALGNKFQENRKALGLAGESSVIELYVSNKGSWTLTATNTAGIACIIASGEAWQDYPGKVAGLDS